MSDLQSGFGLAFLDPMDCALCAPGDRSFASFLSGERNLSVCSGDLCFEVRCISGAFISHRIIE